MPKAKQVGQHVDLAVLARTRYAIVHFLKEDDVRLAVANRLRNPIGVIATVDAANALVDVVSHEVKMHGDCLGAQISGQRYSAFG